MTPRWQHMHDLLAEKVQIARDNVRAAERELDTKRAEARAFVEAFDIFMANVPKGPEAS